MFFNQPKEGNHLIEKILILVQTQFFKELASLANNTAKTERNMCMSGY